ncbi:MAG: DUF4959 domain-containing protein [Spirochaetes bacterium]|nr:MAG: DUF4959 domain-containing protein [Spirochaetota bacterium]
MKAKYLALYLCSLAAISSLSTSCGYVHETNPIILADTTPGGPGTLSPVHVDSITPDDTQIIINWTDPADAGFDHVKISWVPDGTSVQTVPKGTETFIASALTNGTDYTFTLTGVYDSGNEAAPVAVTARPRDLVPPLALDFRGTVSSPDQITINWTDPPTGDFDHVIISWEPGGETGVTVAGGQETYTADGMSIYDTDYTFTLTAVDDDGNETAISILVPHIDIVSPSEIMIDSVATSDGSIILNWTDPADADLDHIKITWSPDGATERIVAAGVRTFSATGLNNIINYTFTLIAVDEAGNESAPVTVTQRIDETPPGPVEITGIIEDNQQITLNWDDPSDPDLDHIEISWTPDGAAVNSIDPGVRTFTATGLVNPYVQTNGNIYIITEYAFSIICVDTAGNRSSALVVKAIPSVVGSIENFLIYTADDLNAVRGGSADPKYNGWDKTKSYSMMADIDLSGYSPWIPIGASDTDFFSGNFNGNGHTISGLRINTAANYQGLFGFIKGTSVIRNLTISNCAITGGAYIGALAGQFNQDGTGKAMLSNCHVSGTIISTSSVAVFTGGLVGWLGPNTTPTTHSNVVKCSVKASVSNTSATLAYYLGGITGRAEIQWSVFYCYVEGDISATRGYYVGGIAGSSNSPFENCYSKANIKSIANGGGITGGTTNYTRYCYATGDITRTSGTSANIGGLLGSVNNSDRIIASYYSGTLLDAATGLGLTDNALGTRKTPAEMKEWTTYSGWDPAIWAVDPDVNNGFPYLINNPPR